MFFFPEVSKILNAPLLLPEAGSSADGAAIDSRKVQKGELFIALKGAQSDGHLFLADAFKNGASGALVDQAFVRSRPEILKTSGFKNLIPVDNTEKALQMLASALREKISPVCLAVTGSVGKTSTKEFLTYLLSKKFRVLSTQGNFNNHLGLPLTLMRLKPGHIFCVAELGANHIGEISFLGKILKQKHAILTQVAPSHLEGFGSLDGVYRAKLEIMEPLGKDSVLVIPDHDPRLYEAARLKGVRVIRVGTTQEAEFRLSDARSESGQVFFKVNGKQYAFPGSAVFLAQNAAMALALARSAGLEEKDIPDFWEGLKLPTGRFEERKLDGNIRIIFDGYNANPASFKAAIETFKAMKIAGRKWVVCSDMGELGEKEREFHENLGRQLAGAGLHALLGYGERTRWTLDAARAAAPLEVKHFQSPQQAGHFLKEKIRPEDAVLLKASRSMKIEEVLKVLEAAKLQAAES